jgi:hypothetical protein
MHHPLRDHLLKETPLERIFRRVIGRKMTEPERISFHLKIAVKPEKRKPM